MAGAETIEHGDFLDLEVANLMKEHSVTYFPTLAAVEMITRYRGWQKGKSPDPLNIKQKKKSFSEALASGVTIGMGGDVGVFPHGENVIEMELMVEYGMKPLDVLKSATSVNAKAMHWENQIGWIKPGMKADIAAFSDNPTKNISDIRKVVFVMKDGVVVRSAK
jgi:imidazolonepropionase-like amidohydrolase